MFWWQNPAPGVAVWFTADTHFQHENISDYVRRPYLTVPAMDADLIARWNAVVRPGDLVYHLGDFALGRPDSWAAICRQLAGNKILVRGNHDRSADFMRSVGFDDVTRNAIVCVDGVRLWLHHYPNRPQGAPGPRRTNPPGNWDIALCGHVHDNWLVSDGVVNVGVDVWNFAPISLDAIVKAVKWDPQTGR